MKDASCDAAALLSPAWHVTAHGRCLRHKPIRKINGGRPWLLCLRAIATIDHGTVLVVQLRPKRLVSIRLKMKLATIYFAFFYSRRNIRWIWNTKHITGHRTRGPAFDAWFLKPLILCYWACPDFSDIDLLYVDSAIENIYVYVGYLFK